MDIASLAKNWWALALLGVAAIIFGVPMLLLPPVTLAVLPGQAIGIDTVMFTEQAGNSIARKGDPSADQSDSIREEGTNATSNSGRELVETLARAGVERIYGIVGDSLNPVTDAIRHQMQSSTMRFTENNWQLGRVGAQSFDEIAGSLANMFDFDHPRGRKFFLDPRLASGHHRRTESADSRGHVLRRSLRDAVKAPGRGRFR